MEVKEAKEVKVAKEAKPKDKEGWFWWAVVLVIAALLIVASSITLWKKFGHFHWKGSHSHGGHGPIVDKYSDALNIAMQFFDVQRCN